MKAKNLPGCGTKLTVTASSQTRLNRMEKYLRQTWGKEYQKIRERILDVKPICPRK